MRGGFAVEDGVGLLFEGTGLAEAVTARPGARAYRVELEGSQVVERLIEPRLLTSNGDGCIAGAGVDQRVPRGGSAALEVEQELLALQAAGVAAQRRRRCARTRWQGTTTGIGFEPRPLPAARTAFGLPAFAATSA